MAFLPILAAGLSVAGTAYAGVQKYQADKFNSQVMQNEQNLAVNQANAQEGIVRRENRQRLGAQLASFGGAGVGYGGSSETALDNSAINQELDALNTRYKGAISGYGYGVQSQNLSNEANQEGVSTALLAGAQAMKKINYYPGTPGGGT